MKGLCHYYLLEAVHTERCYIGSSRISNLSFSQVNIKPSKQKKPSRTIVALHGNGNLHTRAVNDHSSSVQL